MAIAPDPADKALEATADGAFGGKPTNRRAGYGGTVIVNGEEITEMEWLIRRAKKDASLASSEGRRLVEHYEAQIAALEEHRDGWKTQADEYRRMWIMEMRDAQRLRDVLKRLREPSISLWEAAVFALDAAEGTMKDAIRAAVAVAEQEANA